MHKMREEKRKQREYFNALQQLYGPEGAAAVLNSQNLERSCPKSGKPSKDDIEAVRKLDEFDPTNFKPLSPESEAAVEL